MFANEIQKVTKNVGIILAKNSPTILTGLGVAGLITTTVMAVKATPKALSIIDDEVYKRYKKETDGNKSFGEWLGTENGYDISARLKVIPVRDIIKHTWKCYIPAAIMGGLTVGCIISANSVNLRRNAALASAYSLSEVALKEYKAKVAETIGKTKEQKIKDDIAKDKIDKNPVNNKEVIITGKGETLCYDLLSGRYFKSDIETIRKALNRVSRTMLSEMFVSLNDVYYELGLPHAKMGDLLGWHIDDGIIEADFSSHLATDGTPCLAISFSVEPRYMDFN